MRILAGPTPQPIVIEGATAFAIVNAGGGPILLGYDENLTPDNGYILYSGAQVRLPASFGGVALHAAAEGEDLDLRILPAA